VLSLTEQITAGITLSVHKPRRAAAEAGLSVLLQSKASSLLLTQADGGKLCTRLRHYNVFIFNKLFHCTGNVSLAS